MCGAAFDLNLSSFAPCMMGLGALCREGKEGTVHAFRLIALLQPEHLLSSCIACSDLFRIFFYCCLSVFHVKHVVAVKLIVPFETAITVFNF